jgi:hypothetical protein
VSSACCANISLITSVVRSLIRQFPYLNSLFGLFGVVYSVADTLLLPVAMNALTSFASSVSQTHGEPPIDLIVSFDQRENLKNCPPEFSW